MLVALLNPLIKKMRQSKRFSVFLDAVNVASVAMIASICLTMGKETLTDWRTLSIAIISMAVVFRFRKINNAFIVIGGALLGFLLYL